MINHIYLQKKEVFYSIIKNKKIKKVNKLEKFLLNNNNNK